jgi:hypothetical protein
MAARSGVRFSPTVTLVLVVLALAAGALISKKVDGPAPGTLRVGVLASESPLRIERAVGPLATWLAGTSHLAGEVVAPGTAGIEELATRADVMLVPERVTRGMDATRILAWVRPVGTAGAMESLVLVESETADGRGRCAVATAGLVPDMATAACDSVAVARSPFADRQLLRAWVAGGYSAVLVRGSVVEEARQAGWFADRPSSVSFRSQTRGWLAMVASENLDDRVRRRTREAALNLDKYRLDPSHKRAASVLNALAELGIGGFIAPEVLGALRQ